MTIILILNSDQTGTTSPFLDLNSLRERTDAAVLLVRREEIMDHERHALHVDPYEQMDRDHQKAMERIEARIAFDRFVEAKYPAFQMMPLRLKRPPAVFRRAHVQRYHK